MFINKQIAEEKVPGFEAYTPRVREEKTLTEEERKAQPQVFGRRTRRYSNRL
jgi:hypothetical protein